jgi:hypothetical protein
MSFLSEAVEVVEGQLPVLLPELKAVEVVEGR